MTVNKTSPLSGRISQQRNLLHQKKIHFPHEKKVSFQTTVQVREIPSLNTYSKEQLTAIYHTTAEFKAIRNELSNQLHIIQNKVGKLEREDDNSEWCFRGLELETKEGRKERRIRQNAARIAVFQEQACQRERRVVNLNYLAMLYAIKTYGSIQLAIEKGVQDEFDARNYKHP